jgi:hypothetical protein
MSDMPNWREVVADACAVVAGGATEEFVRRSIGGKAGPVLGSAAGLAVGAVVREAVLKFLNEGWEPGRA